MDIHNVTNDTPALPAQTTLPRVQTLLQETVQLCIHHLRLFAGILGLYVVLLVTLTVAAAVLLFLTNFTETSANLLIGAALWWVGVALASLWYQVSLLYAVGNTPSDIYQSYDETRTYLWSYLLLNVAVTLGVVAGFLLFILPGIFLMVRWWFAPFVLVYERKTVRESLRTSASLVRGRWWRVAGYLLVPFVAISIVSYAAGGLMIFMTSLSVVGAVLSIAIALFMWCMIPPCMFGYSYFLYRGLASTTTPSVKDENAEPATLAW